MYDVTNDDRWADHREIVLAHGLRAAWSVPILGSDGDSVLGTLDVFVSEPRLPDDEHRQIFVLLAQLASIAIERKAFEERLAHQSMHDPLTGLPNRLLFLDRLTQAIARCRRTQTSVGVAFLDLDRFKNVNDSLGHDAGDELLVEVARKLESVIRPGDTVARFGGDEFTVLCEDLPSETARERTVEIAERLRSAVIRPLVVRGTEMFVGASVGIAMATSGEERPEELLRDADAAMYHAKEAGRGRVEIFDDAMRARALTAHATENALHRALERAEFRIFFQPIVGLSDARCVGAEALVRWQHPERGLIAPAEFIPLAEETGLVVRIGWWVLEEAARNAARWQLEQSEPFQVSVNLSARQLAQPDLADRVAEVIAETGVHPSSLCFEITESVLMDDAETVLDVITRVRARRAVRDRRLRNRLLLARLPEAVPGRLREDRPIVRERVGFGSRRCGHRVGRHRFGSRARAARDRRGRRDGGPAHRAHRARLRRGPGILLLAAAACSRPAQPDRAHAHVAPTGSRRDAAGRRSASPPPGGDLTRGN